MNNLLSGCPELRRYYTQKAMNYAAMWPLETRWSWEEFSWVCAILGVRLVLDDNVVWIESITF